MSQTKIKPFSKDQLSVFIEAAVLIEERKADSSYHAIEEVLKGRGADVYEAIDASKRFENFYVANGGMSEAVRDHEQEIFKHWADGVIETDEHMQHFHVILLLMYVEVMMAP